MSNAHGLILFHEIKKYEVLVPVRWKQFPDRNTMIELFKERLANNPLISIPTRAREYRKLSEYIKNIDRICSDEQEKLKKLM